MALPPIDLTHFTQPYLAEYNGDPVTAVAVLCIVLNTVFIAFRLLSRHMQVRSFGWDDGLIIMSWMTNLGLSTAILLNLRFGGGHHIEYLLYHQDFLQSRGLLDLVIEPIIFAVAVAFPKLAILVLYLRIFTNRYTRGACWVVIGIMIVSTVVNIFLFVFQCNPMSRLWDPALMDVGYCHDVEAHWTWGPLPHLATDFIMLLLPIPTIWRLKASLQTKLGVAAMFAVGSIGMVLALVRWIEFYHNRQFIVGDQSWYDYPLAIWGVLEPTAYLLSACLLGNRGFWRNLAATRPVSYISNRFVQFQANDASTINRSEKRSLSQQGFHLDQKLVSTPSAAFIRREQPDAAAQNIHTQASVPFGPVYGRHDSNIPQELAV